MQKTLLLISGKLQSGKNTLADLISAAVTGTGATVSQGLYAQALKEGCSQDFRLLSEFLREEHAKLLSGNPGIPEDTLGWMNVQESQWWDKKSDLTRVLLQIYGTEIFRNRVDTDHWVKSLMAAVESSTSDLFVVTDTRYPNELELPISWGAQHGIRVQSVRVERPELARSGLAGQHTSEIALDDYTGWDYVVRNSGTMEDLKEIAKNLATRLLA
jgi:hypothetical protein